MLFLLTCETNDNEFVETLIETSKIATIRLVHHRDEYKLVLQDVCDSNFVARFETEAALRTRFAQLLVAMDADVSLAETMKIGQKNESSSKELLAKLAEAVKKM